MHVRRLPLDHAPHAARTPAKLPGVRVRALLLPSLLLLGLCSASPALALPRAVVLRLTGVHRCPSRPALRHALARQLAPSSIVDHAAAGALTLTARSVAPGRLVLTLRDGDRVMERVLEAPTAECAALAETAALVVDGWLRSPAPEGRASSEKPVVGGPPRSRTAPPAPPPAKGSPPIGTRRAPAGASVTPPAKGAPPLVDTSPPRAPVATPPRPMDAANLPVPPALEAPRPSPSSRPEISGAPSPAPVPPAPAPLASPPASTPSSLPVAESALPRTASSAPLPPSASRALPLSAALRLGGGLVLGLDEGVTALGLGHLAVELTIGARFGVGLRGAVVSPMHFSLAPGAIEVWRVPLGLYAIGALRPSARSVVTVRAGLALDVSVAAASGYSVSRSVVLADPGLLVGVVGERLLGDRWSLYGEVGLTTLLRNESYSIANLGTAATTARAWLDLGVGVACRFP